MNSPPSAWVDPIHMQNNSNQKAQAGAKSGKRKRGNNPPDRPAKRSKGLDGAPLSTRTRQSRVSRDPKFSQTKGGTRIRHREYIGDLNGSVNFSVSSYPLNPGVATTFPWLANVARQYESYKFHKLHLEFDGGRAATVDGKYALAVDFDAADAAPTSKLDLLNFEGTVSLKAWEDGRYVCSPSNLSKMKSYYVRSGALANNLDIKTYDVGTFFVATSGQAANTFIGELFIEYDVEFMTPQLNAATNTNSGVEYNSTGAGVSNSNILGTGGASSGSIGVSNVLNVVTLTNLTPGTEYMSTVVVGCASSATAMTQAFSAGATLKNLVFSSGGGLASVGAPALGGAQTTISVYTFTASATTCTVTLGGITAITTPTGSLMTVTPIPTIAI